jgi:hypothetical protein
VLECWETRTFVESLLGQKGLGTCLVRLEGNVCMLASRSCCRLLLALLTLLASLGLETSVWAGIHRAPVVLPANRMKIATQYPVSAYRVFRRGVDGEAVPIPFQIDEINAIGDYVLGEGPKPNSQTADGIFDGLDELSFMGDDVGPVGMPTRWPDGRAPQSVFELRMTPPAHLTEARDGAVYLAVYHQNPPAPVNQKYVVFNLGSGEVRTSRYRYLFDRQNYLVVNGVDMVKGPTASANQGLGTDTVPLIDSSTFYARADLKYFLTVQVNHRSVNSRLESFKTGPIRTIVRVTFFYTFLKLNFEVGMYTEVSFFSNSVILPAIIYNPLDGIKSLNRGSGFYYGFALRENPRTYQFSTNMRPYTEASDSGGLFGYFKKDTPVEKEYWASLIGEDRMMYVLLRPSPSMLQEGNVPFYYLSEKSGDELKARNNNEMKPIIESPVNLGLYFDLTKFREGEHLMAFQLFFENKKDYKSLETFRNLDKWQLRLSRM